MTLVFSLKRKHNGKKSRWSRKYPRKKITKGGEKAARWFKNNWIDDSFTYLPDISRFLLANVGRPVNKVFSEFLKRCKPSIYKYNVKEWFFDNFEEKESISYTGGFYLTNGIINYKKPYPKPIAKKSNTLSLSDDFIKPFCIEAEEVNYPILLGDYCSSKGIEPLYIVKASIYEDLSLRVCRNYERFITYSINHIYKVRRPWTWKERYDYGIAGDWTLTKPYFYFVTKKK